MGFVYVRRQLGKESPLLPFDLLRIPIFSLSILTSICSFTAQMLAMVSLPFILQHSLGYTPVDTGLLLMAWPMVIVVVAPLAGRLVERIHAGRIRRPPMSSGGWCCAVRDSGFSSRPTTVS